MPTDAEITFADHMGRFYVRRYGFPPMVGRLLGYLAVCDPPEQTAADIANLGMLMSEAGQSGPGAALLRQALTIYENTLGANSGEARFVREHLEKQHD